MSSAEAEFVDYANAAAGRLHRFAYLLCHDWHLAQDLTQTALAKFYVSWAKVQRADSRDAYIRKVLVRAFLDHQRRRSSSEIAVPEPDADGAYNETHELRLTLIQALAHLPARQRAMVVLRFWEDQTVEGTAQLLGLSGAVVQRQTLRALDRLRVVLQDDELTLFARSE